MLEPLKLDVMLKLRRQVFPFFFMGAILCLTTACQQEDFTLEEPTVEDLTSQEETYANVDERLWVYYSRFEEEAANRGLVIDLAAANISGEIAEIDQEHVAGQCRFHSHAPNHITIDLEFWNRSSDLFKEFIIFHELGHCFLGRDHREDTFTDGTCKSLMRSGVEDCRDNYNNATRTRYLNELFQPSSV